MKELTLKEKTDMLVDFLDKEKVKESIPVTSTIKWDVARQVRLAKESYEQRPEWMKRVSYFA